MKKFIFTEEYIIRYSFKNEDGYLRKAEAIVKIKLDGKSIKSEKNNHSLAKQIFLSQNPGCTIDSVRYV